jgi:hypothetical protein
MGRGWRASLPLLMLAAKTAELEAESFPQKRQEQVLTTLRWILIKNSFFSVIRVMPVA